MPNTIFTNVRIFDGSGAPLFPGEVEVQALRGVDLDLVVADATK